MRCTFKISDSVYPFYMRITNPILRFYYMVKRMIYWGWHLRHNEDWDNHYLYEIMYLKLKKMKHCFDTVGVHVPDKGDKVLAICIQLLSRLMDDNYLSSELRQIEKIYGVISYDFDASSEECIRMTFANIPTDKDNIDYKRAKKMYTKACKNSDYMQQQDIDLLFKLMKKYHQHWWD